MNWREAVAGLLWPKSAPIPDRRFRFGAQNGAALKGSTLFTPTTWDTIGAWGGGSIPLSEGRSATYAQMYARQPMVYAVVNKLVRGIGRLPLKAYQRADNGSDRERLTTGPLAELLAAPYERGSPTTLSQRIVGDLAIYGNAIVVAARRRESDPATTLQPMHPAGWTVFDDGTYRLRPPGKPEQVFEPWEILHHKFYRPGEDFACWGLSPLEPLRQALLTEDFAQRFAAAVFENGGQPGLALETEKGVSDDDLARIRAQFEDRHVGGSNAGRPLILTGGLKAHPWEVNLDETTLIEHRKLTREEVCAAYDISPVMIGLLERATNNNIEELHMALYVDSFGPWLTLKEEVIEAQLLRGVPAYAGQFVEHDLNEVLKGNIQARYDAINKAVGGPWMARTEARRLENLPAIAKPDYDLLLAPLNMSTIPAPPPTAATPAPNGAKEHAHA